jgi:hypothetical protein
MPLNLLQFRDCHVVENNRRENAGGYEAADREFLLGFLVVAHQDFGRKHGAGQAAFEDQASHSEGASRRAQDRVRLGLYPMMMGRPSPFHPRVPLCAWSKPY